MEYVDFKKIPEFKTNTIFNFRIKNSNGVKSDIKISDKTFI